MIEYRQENTAEAIDDLAELILYDAAGAGLLELRNDVANHDLLDDCVQRRPAVDRER